MYHYSFFLPAPWGSKVGGGLKEFDTCCGLAVLWAKNLDEDGKVLWNLGAHVFKISSKVALFLALRRPKGGPRWSVQGCNL